MTLSIEEAVQPYLERFKDYSKSQLLSLGGNECGCMGPDTNMPLCRCSLIRKAQEILLDKWYNDHTDNHE